MNTDIDSLIRKGDAYLAEGLFRQALETFTKAIEADPKRAKTYYRRSEAYYDRWCDLIGKAPSDLDKYEEWENTVRRRKDLNLSLKDLNAAIVLVPDLAEAHFGKGVILYEKGHYRDAVLSYSQAISLYKKGVYRDTVHSFGKTMSLQDCKVSAHYQRALAYEHLDNDARTLADLTTAIRMDPTYADAYLERGVIYASQKKYAKAVEEIDKAISLKPRAANYHCHRAMAISTPAFDTMDVVALSEALDGMTEAIKLDPKNAQAYFDRSILHGLLDNYQEELDDLSTAIRLEPDYAAAYRQRFECLAQLGKKEQAAQNWAQCCARSKKANRIMTPDTTILKLARN